MKYILHGYKYDEITDVNSFPYDFLRTCAYLKVK